MSEKKSVITGRKVNYEGIFSYGELMANTDNFMSKRIYTKKVGLHAETVKPKGKFIKIENEYKRVINEYCAYIIKIAYQLENLKDVEVVREGKKLKMNKGKVQIEINSYVITDYESHWEKSPVAYVFRRLLHKFFIGDVHDKWVNDVKTDVEDYIQEISSYFNFQEYTK